MVVAVCIMRLHLLDEPGSLKGKRQVLRRIIDRVRSHFKVSIAEVDDLDNYQITTLGLVLVSSQRPVLERLLSHIESEIMSWAPVEIVSSDTEYLNYNHMHMGKGSSAGY